MCELGLETNETIEIIRTSESITTRNLMNKYINKDLHYNEEYIHFYK